MPVRIAVRHRIPLPARSRWQVLGPLAICLLLAGRADGAIYRWDGGSGGGSNWSDAFNWASNNLPVNNGTADIVMDGSSRTNNTVDVSYSINSLTFEFFADHFVIGNSGPATLTIGAGGITVDSSGHTINAPLVLARLIHPVIRWHHRLVGERWDGAGRRGGAHDPLTPISCVVFHDAPRR